MNVLQIFVTKIHNAQYVDTGHGFSVWELEVDTNCLGHVEKNKKIKLSHYDYMQVLKKGYYWG